MNNKKRWIIISAFALLLVFLITFISAQWFSDFSKGPQDLVQIIKDFFGPIFEAIIGVGQYDQYFFARVLFLIIVYVICSLALESVDLFKGKKGVIFIISAVVAILGARYIGDLKVIEMMLLPYGVIMLSISIALPILIYTFFVHRTMGSGLGRRAAWIFFAVVFIGLWWTRRSDPSLTEFRWIYDIGIFAVLGAVVFDSKLHEYFGLIEAAEFKRATVKKQIADIESELAKYSNIQSPSRTTQEVIRHLEERRSTLSRKL